MVEIDGKKDNFNNEQSFLTDFSSFNAYLNNMERVSAQDNEEK